MELERVLLLYKLVTYIDLYWNSMEIERGGWWWGRRMKLSGGVKLKLNSREMVESLPSSEHHLKVNKANDLFQWLANIIIYYLFDDVLKHLLFNSVTQETTL